MSRSGYSDDCENVQLWRGAVRRAMGGKRGREFMQELLETLDHMPEKRLAANTFTKGGEVCALGSVALRRGIDVSQFERTNDSEWTEDCDRDGLGKVFGIAPAMVAEIMWWNDELHPRWVPDEKGILHWSSSETQEARWSRVRNWVNDWLTTGDPTS